MGLSGWAESRRTTPRSEDAATIHTFIERTSYMLSPAYGHTFLVHTQLPKYAAPAIEHSVPTVLHLGDYENILAS